MNIYIFGDESFNSSVRASLDKANVVFRLSGTIQDVKSVDELKSLIEEKPQEIFLIDDNQIIKKKKFSLIKKKDGIDEEFLKSSGIRQLTANSLDDIGVKVNEVLEVEEEVSEDMEDTLKEVEKEMATLDMDDLGEIEDSELKELDSLDESMIDEAIENIEEDLAKTLELSEDENFDDMDLSSVSEEDLKDLIDEPIVTEESLPEEIELSEETYNEMAANVDDIFDLDGIDEAMMQSALSGVAVTAPKKVEASTSTEMDKGEVVINSSNVNDLAEIFQNLLSNKALEITIRVKD